MPLSVDASNSCIPPSCGLKALTPPLPTTTRGVPISLDGTGGRINSDRPLLVYPSGRLVVVRELSSDLLSSEANVGEARVRAFVYRGHTANVTTAKFSPSGCYIASGDIRGKLRVWSYDNEEHLCKLDIHALSGPIRDISWDFESKRITVVGEGSKTDATSVCTKVIQWDSGVTLGQMAQHTNKKATTCAFKPSRPMRIVTGGGEDCKILFNKGPPFARMPVVDGIPCEAAHQRGSVHCVRYNKQGTIVASVGTDKSVCFYDGKTMEFLNKLDNAHNSSIYSCAWNDEGDQLLTCSADGTVNLIRASGDYEVVKSWNVASAMVKKEMKVPVGAMQMGCAFVHGNIPVTISLNGTIAALPLGDGAEGASKLQFLIGHQSPISSMAIDHNNGRMYTGDSDGVICMWDAVSGKSLSNVQRGNEEDEAFDNTFMNKVHKGAITGMAVADGKLLSIGWDDKIRLTEEATSTSSIDLGSQPNRIAKGTNLVVVMTVGGLLLVRDHALGSELISTSYEPTSVCVAPNDEVVYVGGNDKNVHVYRVNGDSLEESETLSGAHLQPIYALSLSNDGTKLASADTRDIIIWDLETSSTLIGAGYWCFHRLKINAIAWSNDDSTLATGGNDDSIYLWSLKKKTTRVHYAFAHRDGITAMEFLKHSDGMILASVGNDGCVNQWDVTDDVMKKFG